jgi:membrane-associated HD superfamily phosphohydrolase
MTILVVITESMIIARIFFKKKKKKLKLKKKRILYFIWSFFAVISIIYSTVIAFSLSIIGFFISIMYIIKINKDLLGFYL